MNYCATCCAEESKHDPVISHAVAERSESVLADIEQTMPVAMPVNAKLNLAEATLRNTAAGEKDILVPATVDTSSNGHKQDPPPPAVDKGGEEQAPKEGTDGGASRTFSPDEWAKMQERFEHLPKLPENWIRVKSASTGRLYYFNTLSRESTFSGPWEVAPEWVEMVSKSTGRTYYYNQKVNKSQFGKPAHHDEWACEHELPEFVTDEDGWTCSACSKAVSSGSKMYGCRQCDFDLCAACKMGWQPGRLCTHSLVKFITDVDGWICSFCKKEVAQNVDMYGCRLCDFDLCGDCKAGRAAFSCTHALGLFNTDVDGWTCSACNTSVPKAADMYGCRDCDVDLCKGCFDRSQKIPKP